MFECFEKGKKERERESARACEWNWVWSVEKRKNGEREIDKRRRMGEIEMYKWILWYLKRPVIVERTSHLCFVEVSEAEGNKQIQIKNCAGWFTPGE